MINNSRYFIGHLDDSIVKLMVFITSGISLGYIPCYKYLLNYDNNIISAKNSVQIVCAKLMEPTFPYK